LYKVANRIDGYAKVPLDTKTSGPLSHQHSAHRVLSRYTSFKGKAVLEIGGAQSCDSAHPFIQDGADQVVVTGLDHITGEQQGLLPGLSIMRADALDLSSIFPPNSFDIVYGLSILEHIPCPSRFIEEVYRVLMAGGICYLEGSPLWSSPKGHHIWLSASYSPSTANYFFSGWPGIESTNPLSDWSHLLMTDYVLTKA
jgi:ubiquinone/menaquinone biosynthesis C-methylase UbiE